MVSVWRPSRPNPNDPTNKKARIRRKCYYFSYVDEHGQRQVEKGFTDKTATKALAEQKQKDADRMRVGLPVARMDKLSTPLVEIEEEYIGELRRQGRSDSHLRGQAGALRVVREDRGWATLRDVRADALRTFLGQLVGKSPRTVNWYRDAVVALCNWCVGQEYLGENPVKAVKKARGQKGKKWRPRRAYTLDEFKRMLALNNNRKLAYLVAGLSGLRRKEIRLLEKRDFTPIGDCPLWHLRAEITKGGRLEKVPMVPELAQVLLPLWEKMKPTERLFPTWQRQQALNADLKNAGIEKKNAEGRTVDFHSLRYFFCTQMAKILPIQKVRHLMRHRNIRETADLYMDLGLNDIGEELWNAPSLLTEGKK